VSYALWTVQDLNL